LLKSKPLLAELDGARRIGDGAFIVAFGNGSHGAIVECDGVYRAELDGARGVGDGAVIVPLVVQGTASPSEDYRLVVVRDGAVVLTSTEERTSGIEKGHCEVGL
jgi:hypothetical protein